MTLRFWPSVTVAIWLCLNCLLLPSPAGAAGAAATPQGMQAARPQASGGRALVPGATPARASYSPSSAPGARPPAAGARSRTVRRSPAPATGPVNVNTAPLAVLVTLHGVGEKKARAILAWRREHGPFNSLEQFEEVPGIGPAMIEKNRHRILFR